MMRIVLSLIMLAISANPIFAQKTTAAKKPATTKVAPAKTAATVKKLPADGYRIPITLTPFKNQWVYLGCYFGKYKNLSDSAWVNEKSQGVFAGDTKLPQGIYFVVSPAKVLLFEMLIDKNQKFSIQADTSKLNGVTITGSEDNNIFQDYTKFLVEKTPALNGLHNQLAAAANKKDSASVTEALVRGNKELQDYRENVMAKHPNSMLTAFFHTMKRPDIPQIPVDAKGKADSSYPYRFVKDHWWDGVEYDNDALVRTPFFEPKLEEYYKYYVVPDADSIIAEVNYMLLLSRTAPEMKKYLLGKFTDKYINPEYMGQEKVFLFLFDNYFSKGDTAWLGEKQKRYIFDRAYSLMANQLGEPAAELNMLDTSGKSVSLYALQAPYTFITFWDPNCGHCKEMVPRIDSMYQAKWKAQGVKMVGVNMDDATIPEWKKLIIDQKLAWTHIYQPRAIKDDEAKKGIANFRQLYDVFKTPTLYLLDKDKRIIGKMLSLEQFDEVLQAKIKGKTTN